MGIVSQLRLPTALVRASSSSSSSTSAALYVAVLLIMVVTGAHDVGGLQVGYYANSCPGAETIVTATVGAYHQYGDPFYAAGVLRMHFHDCWVRVSRFSSPAADRVMRSNSSCWTLESINADMNGGL
jgi:hypothetical protein